MRLKLTLADLDSLKADLFHVTPEAPLMRRLEGVARALGFTTYNGLRTALGARPIGVEPNDQAYADFLGLAPTGEPVRVVARVVARGAIRRAQAEFPALTERGFDSTAPQTNEERKIPYPQRLEAFRRRRQEAFSDDAMDQFELAWIYLSQQKRRKTVNTDFGSYGLKHRAEDLYRKFKAVTHLEDYVSNGMLIAAAHAHGFAIKRCQGNSPNAYFNISSVSIRETAARPVMSRTQENRSWASAMRNEGI